jgi:lipopolysaccharide export system protein LptC
MKNKIDLHSKAISWLKVALPSIAAIFMSMILIIPRLNQDKTRLKLSAKKVSAMIEAMKIENAQFLGVDSKNNHFSLDIKSAIQNSKDSENIELTDIVADISFNQNKWINLSSKNAFFDKENSSLELTQDVIILHADGYTFSAEQIIVDITQKTLFSDTPVNCSSPIGKISAQGMNYANQVTRFKGPLHINLFTSKDKK